MIETPEKLETNKNTYKGKTLSDIATDMGFKWSKIAADVAVSLGVCTTKKEYNTALANYDKNNPNDLHLKYNLQILKKIQDGAKITIPGIDPKKIFLFSTEKQKDINQYFGGGEKQSWFAGYINNLTPQQIQELNKMSNGQMLAFFNVQIQGIEANTKKFTNNTGGNNIETNQQISSLLLASEHNKYLDEFRNNPNYADIQFTSEQEVQEMYDALDINTKDVLRKTKTEEQIKQDIRNTNDYAILYKSKRIDQLPEAEKNKFYSMAKSYAEYNESIGLGEFLKEKWGDFYDEVKNMITSYVESTTESDIDAIKNDVVKNEDVKGYFTDNMQDALVDEKDKNYEYYTGLIKLYPTLEKYAKIQELINIENPTEQQKKDLMEIIKKKTESADVEGDVLEETRGVVKEQAVASCLDMLQMYMDIDLGEQENVLDQFKNVEYQIAADKESADIVLQINGKINGKNLKLYYDLTTGKLQQEEFLSRGAINTPFAINDPVNGKKNIPGIQLPKFDDFVTGAKSLDYKEIIQTASKSEEDPMKAYKEQVASELRKNVKKEGTRDMDTEKVRFEKNIMKNLAAQEVFLFMEQNIDESEKSFASTNNKEIYSMYVLIYNSLELYTLDELTAFRKNITILDTYKDKYMQYIKEKDTNKEKYILGMLGQKDVEHVEDKKALKKDGDTENEYTYLKKYTDFFSIFKDTTYTLPIIDPIAFSKYTYHVGLEVSQDQAYLTRDDMKRNFNEVVGTEELPDVEKAYD